MAREYRNRLWLTSDNQHLSDIFFENCYLELGNISYDAMNELLNKKLLNYNRLSYIDIVQTGIGSFQNSNKDLKEKLPFLYFANMVAKNKTIQLVITYGLLVRRKGYKETFIPMVLLPINLYYYLDDFYIQLIFKPLENPYLRSDKKVEGECTYLEKADSIYSIDHFCLNFVKNQTSNVRYESFLTFINTRQPAIQLVHEKFSFDSPAMPPLYSRYAINTNHDACIISSLNSQQRYAVEKAHFGNSFAITGYEGTGKTTILMNIASDAIFHGKRVLYISNSNETLDTVFDFFKTKNLESYIAPFHLPFDALQEKFHELKREQVLDKILKNELATKYQDVEQYETLLSNRILGFPFLEILKELIISDCPKPEEEFREKVMERSNSLYRHEISEVLKSLQIIDKELPKLTSFKESKFIYIPINHQIRHSEDVINLLKNIHSAYCSLYEQKEILEAKYGFNEIYNYARFKNIITNFRNMNFLNIPTTWLIYTNDGHNCHECLENFLEAKKMFESYKQKIYFYQETDFYLKQRYIITNKSLSDITKARNELLNFVFSEADENYINLILEDDILIYQQLKAASYATKTLSEYLEQLNQSLHLSLSFNNEEEVLEIIDFLKLLNESKFSKSWLDIKKCEQIKIRITEIETLLNHYYHSYTMYKNFFNGIENIDYVINSLQKKLKVDANAQYKNHKVIELLEKVKFIKEQYNKIPELVQEYQEISYTSYQYKSSSLPDLDNFINKINDIKNPQIRHNITKRLKEMEKETFQGLLDCYQEFYKTYINLQENYNNLLKYGLYDEKMSFNERLQYLLDSEKYLKRVIYWRKYMSDILNNKKEKITFECFQTLYKKLNALKETKSCIEQNSRYKYLYGEAFEKYLTSVPVIGRAINDFDLFIDLFKNCQIMNDCFSNLQLCKQINEHLQAGEEAIKQINEYFKFYCKVFKDSVSKYYYDDLETIISYFASLMNAHDELQVYLTITDQMKILIKYKLYSLNNYIMEHDREQYAKRFKFGYLKNVYQMYIEKNPQLLNTIDLEKRLEEIIFLENDFIESNIEILKTKRINRFNLNKNINLDYNGYLNQSRDIKFLVLADTQIVNHFIDINLFDLIIIDDAHRLHANEYWHAVKGKQVIIAGTEQQHTSVSQNLISRIRSNSILNLKYRFSKTPLNLLTQMKNIRGRFHNQIFANEGIEVNNENFSAYIIGLFEQEKTKKVNFFTSSQEKVKQVIEDISETFFSKEINFTNVWNFFNKQFNISNLEALSGGYFIEADYNILDLESYALVKDEYLSANMAESLLACQKKLIILDENDLLNGEETIFIKEIKKIINQANTSITFETNQITKKIAKTLLQENIIVLGAINNFSLIVQYNQQYFGILIMEDPNKTELTLLNEYREFKNNDFPTIIVWLSDLVIDYQAAITELVKEVKL